MHLLNFASLASISIDYPLVIFSKATLFLRIRADALLLPEIFLATRGSNSTT